MVKFNAAARASVAQTTLPAFLTGEATGGTYGPIAVVAAFDEATGSSQASQSAHSPAPTAAATPGATSAQSDPQGLSPSTTLKLALAIPITISVIGSVLLFVLAKKKDKYKLLRFITCGLVRKKRQPASSSPTANGFYRPQQTVARQGDQGNLLGNYNAGRDGGDVNFHPGHSGWRVNQVHFHQANNAHLQRDGRVRRDEGGYELNGRGHQIPTDVPYEHLPQRPALTPPTSVPGRALLSR
ncbi:MAG: hypothetical protein OHK93_004780 [Ramalina farinacea]|uniref:Uncharacterized protein n=1 Tax=Ramalina farinacea TaxID=258253 RepID=A0AA43QUQ8_9LECA|nr:hypothetical protein [Ramalina farinacea]